MRLSKLIFTICSGVLLVPSLVLAQGGPGTLEPRSPLPPQPHTSSSPGPSVGPRTDPEGTPRATPSPLAFCTNVGNVTGEIAASVTGNFGQLQTDFVDRAGTVRTGMQGITQKLQAARTEADAKRQAQFAALLSKAQSPDQKTAILAFEAAVTGAVTADRAAIDAADQTYEQGLLVAIADRKGSLESAATTYKAAITAALAAAQSSCAAGTPPQTVRATLQTALQAARTSLQTAVSQANKIGPNVQTLASARQSAVSAANQTLKTAVQQALTTLKAALGSQSSPSPSPTP